MIEHDNPGNPGSPTGASAPTPLHERPLVWVIAAVVAAVLLAVFA